MRVGTLRIGRYRWRDVYVLGRRDALAFSFHPGALAGFEGKRFDAAQTLLGARVLALRRRGWRWWRATGIATLLGGCFLGALAGFPFLDVLAHTLNFVFGLPACGFGNAFVRS